jgi:hypothetical protein
MPVPLDPVERLVAVGLGVIFLLLGLLFVALPHGGALLFGIEAPDGEGLAYVRAIGFRDVALGFYIAALAVWSDRTALRIVLAVTVVIPVMDFALVWMHEGSGTSPNLILHGLSAAIFAGAAACLGRRRRAGR